MFDIHSHVLFEIDDGAKSLDEAVELCRMAHEDGTQAIVATPHIRESVWPNNRARIEQRLADLRGELARRAVPVEVVLGCEVYFDAAMVEAVRSGAYPTYADRQRHVLFELPTHFVMRQVQEVVFELRTSGITPVLAHPERNAQVMKDMDAVRDLVRMGTVLQLTAMSVTGHFGRQAKRAADLLLDEELAQVVASDAHSPRFRSTRLRAAYDRVARRWGQERAETLFVSNPRRVVAGEEIDVPPREPRRPGFFQRLSRALAS